MKLLLVLVLVLFVSYMGSGYLAARRHRVPFNRVMDAQWASLKRIVVLAVWAVMVLPLPWTVLAKDGSSDLAGYLSSSWPLYVSCFAILWLLRGWPFKRLDRNAD